MRLNYFIALILIGNVNMSALSVESKPLSGVQKEGWHFFNEEKEKEQEENENNTTVEPLSEEALSKMTAKEFAELLEAAKEIAVMHPTDHNVREYIKIQNWATKQSERFMDTWIRVSLKDSELDMGAPVAKGTFARRAAQQQRELERKQLFEDNLDRIGLVLFYDPNRPEETKAQERVLSLLTMNYPFVVRKIDVRENPDTVKNLNITVFPDIWMIYRQEDETPFWHRVKAGLAAENEILDGIEYVYREFIENKDL